MSQVLDTPQTANGEKTQALAVAAHRREIRVVEDSSPLANLMDTARFEHLQRIAISMSLMSVLPDHLCGRANGDEWIAYPKETIQANCLRVVNQAVRWGIDPYAMVDSTYVVGGKLGYEGKLVAAIVNSRGGLKHRLAYRFEGSGENRTVTVSGTFRDEEVARESTLRLGDARTKNQMWNKDPDQKLIYSAVVKWARRYCPEVVLGVVTDDDLERIEQNKATAVIIDDRPKGAAAVLAQIESRQPPTEQSDPAPATQPFAPAESDDSPAPVTSSTADASVPPGVDPLLEAYEGNDADLCTKTLYAAVKKKHAGAVDRKTLEGALFKYSQVLGTPVEKFLPETWVEIHRAVVAGKFDLKRGAIEQ